MANKRLAILRKLEDQVGVRLLNRTSRSLSATVAGERLAKQLTAGFTTIDEALTSLARRTHVHAP